MKAYYVLIVLLCSIAISVWLYITSIKNQDEIDRFGNSIRPVKSYIPANAKLGFKGEPNKSELLAWARYQLAPAYISPDADHDTVLSVQYKQDSDGSLQHYLSGRKVIWQASDTVYIYSLTIPYAKQ